MDLDKVEKNFEVHLTALKNAKSIKELVKLQEPFYSMKFYNKKFKGNFKKAKEWTINQAHIEFNNTMECYLYEDFEEELVK